MAVKASMSRLASAVAVAVHDFASDQGWGRDEYTMVATYHSDREMIYLVVGSIHPLDRAECTNRLMESLGKQFGSRSAAFYHVVPIVRQIPHLNEIYQYLVLEDDEIDMTDML